MATFTWLQLSDLQAPRSLAPTHGYRTIAHASAHRKRSGRIRRLMRLDEPEPALKIDPDMAKPFWHRPASAELFLEGLLARTCRVRLWSLDATLLADIDDRSAIDALRDALMLERPDVKPVAPSGPSIELLDAEARPLGRFELGRGRTLHGDGLGGPQLCSYRVVLWLRDVGLTEPYEDFEADVIAGKKLSG